MLEKSRKKNKQTVIVRFVKDNMLLRSLIFADWSTTLTVCPIQYFSELIFVLIWPGLTDGVTFGLMGLRMRKTPKEVDGETDVPTLAYIDHLDYVT